MMAENIVPKNVQGEQINQVFARGLKTEVLKALKIIRLSGISLDKENRINYFLF